VATALAILGIGVVVSVFEFVSVPEFWTITGGPALSFPTAVFASQEAMITREAADCSIKFLGWRLGFQAALLSLKDLARESDTGCPYLASKSDVHHDRSFPLKRFFEVFDSRFGVGVKFYIDTLY